MDVALIVIGVIFVYLFGHYRGFASASKHIPKKKYQFTASIFVNNYKISGENLMTQVPFDAKSVGIAFGGPKDSKGNDAQVQEGTLKISSTDDSILTVEQSTEQPDNPYAAKVNFTGKAGAAQVTIEADADLGEGVETITGAETFEVPAGKASVFGTPQVGNFEMNTPA